MMAAPIRIALVVDPITALIGGGRHPVELAAALAMRGHEVRVFGLPPEWLGRSPSASEEKIDRRLGPLLLSFEPKAIVAYDGRSPAAWLGARVARRLDVPLVLVEAEGWSDRSAFERLLRGIGESLWGRFVRRTTNAVVALDPSGRTSSMARGFDAERIELVPPGIDVQRYRPGLSSDVLIRRRVRGRILSCRLPRDPDAVHELVIDAFARTVGQRDDWSLVMISGERAPAAFRLIADRRGVGARVFFIDSAECDLPAVLSSSTLFAAPSDSRRDGVDLECALACGVPVLAVESPRTTAFIRHDEHGLLSPEGDRDAWTGALRLAASSPERRKRWGAAARQLALERFGWDAVAARFERTLGRDSTPHEYERDGLTLPATRS